ncbi:MAG: T9SS type A sorting domain-containing protein [Saprospiraceae bacterium]|nr:T9SS type A sorting domain-containing protein [Saprospiraceae bacterium]
MKFFNFFIIVLFLFPKLFFSQRFDVKILLEDKLREFIVVKPLTPPPPGGYPIVFMLHGTSGDGEKFFNISGWKELGVKENIVTVFPSSLSYCIVEADGSKHPTTKWNNGDLQSVACPNQEFKDDVLFFKKMVDTISAVSNINSSMIYVAGFSNGGVMAGKLALELPDVFAAATCTSAFIHDLDSNRVKSKIPFWNMFGTHDSMFIERTGFPYVPFNDSCLAYMRNGIGNALGSFGLDTQYIKTQDSLTLNYEYTTPLNGETPNFFKFSMINGMGHNYPNGVNFPMFGAALHWEFFKSHQKISYTSTPQKLNEIYVWPNPVSDRLNLSELNFGDQVKIMDLQGRIYKTDILNNQLNIQELPAQIYILSILHSDHSSEHFKIIKVR